MNNAPPIIGALEFFAYENESILVEMNNNDEALDLLRSPLSGKVILIFSPTLDIQVLKFDATNVAVVQIHSVYEAHKIIKSINSVVDYTIINRIDMMDLNLSPKERGAQQSAYIGMLTSPKVLRGSNLIVTSSHRERSIETRVTKHLNLRH